MGPFDSALISDDSMHADQEGFLPSPQDTRSALESMAGAAHFSTMDFKSGFWQVHMAPELQQYTVFMVSNLGFYEFIRMPFGLCNTPMTFQHLIAKHTGRVELDLLCHLPRQCDSIWSHRRGTS